MTPEFGIEILRSLPFFAGFSPEEYRMLEGKYDIVAYPKGAIIYNYGDPPGAFYCVLSGGWRLTSGMITAGTFS